MSIREVPAVEAVCDRCGWESPIFDDEEQLTEALTAGRFAWLIRTHQVLCPTCKEAGA